MCHSPYNTKYVAQTKIRFRKSKSLPGEVRTGGISSTERNWAMDRREDVPYWVCAGTEDCFASPLNRTTRKHWETALIAEPGKVTEPWGKSVPTERCSRYTESVSSSRLAKGEAKWFHQVLGVRQGRKEPSRTPIHCFFARGDPICVWIRAPVFCNM